MDDVLKSIFDGINNSVNSLNDKIKNTEGTVNAGLDDFAKKMIPNEKDLPETFLVGAVGCILPAAKIIDKAVKMQNNPNEKITTKDVLSTIGLTAVGLTPMAMKIYSDNEKRENSEKLEEELKKCVEYYENEDIPFDERLKTARKEIEKSLKNDEKKVTAKILLLFYFSKFENLLDKILKGLIGNHPERDVKPTGSMEGKIKKIKKFTAFQDSTLNALSEDTLKQISDLRNKLAHGNPLTNENLETALPVFDLIRDFLLKYYDK